MLVDTCGGIKLLVATIPLLLVSPCTTLHMKSHGTQPHSKEVQPLDDILCHKQRNFMCALFGLSPLGSLTHVSTTNIPVYPHNSICG